jgi:hypothetical protein
LGGFLRRFFGGKSISVTSLLVIVLLITMSSWNLFNYYKQMRGKSDENIVFQKKMIDVTLNHVENLLKSGQEDAALTLVDANYASSFFDFFVIQKNGEMITQSSNIGSFDIHSIPVDAVNFPIKGETNTFFLFRKSVPPYEVVLGYFPADLSRFSFGEIKKLISYNIQDTIILFLAIAGLVLREYFKQIKLIKLGRREDFEKLNPLTHEGKILKDLFIHASNLTRQKIELEVPDGVEVELSRGTKDRSVFKGAIVRIDLNQYSTFCKELGQTKVDSLLSPVFSEFREVAQRYGFYEVADEGDERVFYYRSDDRSESSRLSLFAIRAMFECGKSYALDIKRENGIDFKFKASCSFDDLLFVKEDGKYKLKGNAHIISKRCINTFKERNERDFVIALPAADFVGCEDLAEKYSAESKALQGIGDLDLVYISLLKQKPEETSQYRYFRSNSDITSLLKKLERHWDEAEFWAIYKTLQSFKSIVKLSEHADLVISLVEKSQKEKVANEIIASLLMLIPKLTPPSSVNERVVTILKTFLQSENPRTKANALEALGELQAAYEDAKSLLSSEDNRTKANALVIVGRTEMNSDVEKNLRKILRSDDERELMSGLFAVDKLFSYHSRRDLTFFKTSAFFKNLFEELLKLKERPSERVKSKTNFLIETYRDLLY